ncbi:transmembrane channel-like gene family 5 [Cricetulus griseus]
MSAFHRNSSYDGHGDYPGYSGSQNHTRSHLKTQDHLELPGSLDNSGFHHLRSNPYSSGSRTNPDYPSSVAEADYPGSLSNTGYRSPRSPSFSAHSRTRPDYHESLPEPDYNDFQSDPYCSESSPEPDYPGFQRHSGFAGIRRSTNYEGSRTNVGYLGSLKEPDYPGARGSSDNPGPRASSKLPGSRRDVGYTGSRIGSYPDNLGEPDYPGADSQPNSPHFYGEPDYPGAEGSKNAPGFWGEPDYPDAEEGHSYGSSKLGPLRRKIVDKEKSKQLLEANCCAQCLSSLSLFTVAEKNTLQFTGLEFFTGAGYFRDTVMYYGFYTNSTIQHGTSGPFYNMQLAYIFTIGACLVVCFFSLLFSMAKYFRNNFINPHIYSRGIAKLVFCWDFTVTHEKAVKLKQKNLSTEIRENLSEIRQENNRLTLNQQLTQFSAHVAAWLVSTGVAAACCLAVYYLAEYNSEFLKTHRNPGAVLLLPFVVSCINLVVPRFYSMFRLVERYEVPRQEVYILLIRNILLKISIVGILCYYWLNIVALSGEECWETLIGQDIYRLLLMDFVFSLADSLLGEFLRRLKPSADCGPFRGLPSFIESIYSWIDTLSRRSGYLWVVWIYQNLIGSVHFFFILTLIVLIITYLYWQITEGRKIMIRLLHEQIINEGKDKMFLIEKLTKLQDMEKRANPSALILERREVEIFPWDIGKHTCLPNFDEWIMKVGLS